MEVGTVAREKPCAAWNRSCFAVFGMVVLGLFQGAAIQAQVSSGSQQSAGDLKQSSPARDSGSSPAAESELQTGTALTRKGAFREAIPHLLAARGRVGNEYAATFNLALCYVATRQSGAAIEVLNDLGRTGHDSVDVQNLLAQAYIGNAQLEQALASVEKAATLSPSNEKLYLFVADACMEHRDYGLGLKVADIGLRNLPQSARLHYEQAMLLTELDRFDEAKPQFELARKLAAGSEIGYLAAAQQELFAGEIVEAVGSARAGVKQGFENPALLTILGEALIRSGTIPGQADFREAQTALEKAVRQRPNDPASEVALGSLYLTAGRLEDAISHLEMARQLEPDRAPVYANLAKAYQRHGDVEQAQDALEILEKLNQEQADRIRSAPGDRKTSYGVRVEEAGPSHQR